MANSGVIEGAIHLAFGLIMSWLTCNVFFGISSSFNNNKIWDIRKLPIAANTNNHYVFPVQAFAGDTGSNSSSTPDSIVMSSVVHLHIGVVRLQPSTSITLYVDNVATDDAKQVYVELQTPDNLADTSVGISFYNESNYQTARTCKISTTYESVSSTSTNVVHLDDTTYDSVYGSGNGRAIFPKGIPGDTKSGSLTNSPITYLQNKGTKNRIGMMLYLPSVSSRSDFSKVCMGVVLYYSASSTAIYEFIYSTNSSYGLQNLTKSWIVLYDPASSIVDFSLFLYIPKNLIFLNYETGSIVSLTLFLGNGTIYYGQITYADLTLDSNSTLIPNFLKGSTEGYF